MQELQQRSDGSSAQCRSSSTTSERAAEPRQAGEGCGRRRRRAGTVRRRRPRRRRSGGAGRVDQPAPPPPSPPPGRPCPQHLRPQPVRRRTAALPADPAQHPHPGAARRPARSSTADLPMPGSPLISTNCPAAGRRPSSASSGRRQRVLPADEPLAQPPMTTMMTGQGRSSSTRFNGAGTSSATHLCEPGLGGPRAGRSRRPARPAARTTPASAATPRSGVQTSVEIA